MEHLCKGQSPLEALLPPKEETDTLVSFYLDHLEHLHRVVHIPTFQNEYTNFWEPGRHRYPAMSALILAMISVSCASFSLSDSNPFPSTYRSMPMQWIAACEDWLREQSSKHRKLVHYQISCVVYLAKRMNMVSKKSAWNETGSLIQNAIIDGLHCDPSPSADTPYTRELKRRIWSVLRELALQNTFEHGLPTLLHNIDSNVNPPANLDDDEFDGTSKELPIAKPPGQYTYTSYQSHSSSSWTLRLEISRRLFSPGTSGSLSYQDVLRYTHEITQAIDSLPRWDTGEVNGQNGSKLPALVYSFLHFQLKECILALHRAYLQTADCRFRLSETVCYEASRDILILNRKLAGLGIQSLTLLRDDLLLASLSLTRITMLHSKGWFAVRILSSRFPKNTGEASSLTLSGDYLSEPLTSEIGSNSIIMAGSEHTIKLLEDCLPFMEDIYLRCFYGEPWCFLMMFAAIMLLRIHLGKESRQTAKASCARRFLDLHYKHIGRHQESILSQQHPTLQNTTGQVDVSPITASIMRYDCFRLETLFWATTFLGITAKVCVRL